MHPQLGRVGARDAWDIGRGGHGSRAQPAAGHLLRQPRGGRPEDGGGAEFGQEYIDIVRQRYGSQAKVYEFCSGPSFIGFSLYGAGLIRKKLVLSDIHSPLKDSIKKTLEVNKINIDVTFYNIDRVSQVKEKDIDLVIANPPHFSSVISVKEAYPNKKNINTRLIIDQDWLIHREFYENIGNKLSENGVILIQENKFGSSVEDFREMIECSGLDITDVFAIKQKNGEPYTSLTYYIEIKKNKSNS